MCLRRLHAALAALLCGLVLLAGCGLDSGDPPLGAYRGVLSVAGGDLPFGIELTQENGETVAWLINGPERVRAPDTMLKDGHLTIQMPGYPHKLQADFRDARFEGTVQLLRPRGVIRSLRFVGMPGQEWRFFPKPDAQPADFSGRWSLTFRDEEGNESVAIAELTQQGHEVHGTILRPSGDDRYIAGEARGDTLFLSRFDGGSAYLYLGRLGADGVLAGDFHTGGGAHETWSGRRNADAKLPDPTQLSGLKPGIDRVAFTFPDLDGRPYVYPGPSHQGKVVLITIGGSWCPNCHDEAVFLKELLASRRPQGLEVIQLMFEYTPDFASAAASARAFTEKFGIEYPVLIAGITSDGDVLKKLPQMAAMRGYPTMFAVDRSGRVRTVHTGFNGPATGGHYAEQSREMSAFVDALLKEPAT